MNSTRDRRSRRIEKEVAIIPTGRDMKLVPRTRPTKADEYIASLPTDQSKALQRLREQILAAAPGAEEHFGYGMPAFKYYGHPMVYIGAAKNHCALYGSVPPGFKEALKEFAVSKGTIKFTPDRPLPAGLVKEIVKAKCLEIEIRWGHAGRNGESGTDRAM